MIDLSQNPPVPDSDDVLEDIIEAIVEDSVAASPFVRIALRALGPEFNEAWETAYFQNEEKDGGLTYQEHLEKPETVAAIAKINEMMSVASGEVASHEL